MSQFIKASIFDASIVTGTSLPKGDKPGRAWFAISGRGVDVMEAQERFGGMLFFSRGPSGYSLQEQLKSNPFAQGSTVEATLHLSEGLEFTIVGLKVTSEGQGAKAVRPMQKKSEAAAPAATAAPAQVRVS